MKQKFIGGIAETLKYAVFSVLSLVWIVCLAWLIALIGR